MMFPAAKLPGPVKTSLTEGAVLLESDASLVAPLAITLIGLVVLNLPLISAMPISISILCTLICFLISAELLLRPRILVSSKSRSIQVLEWSWRHLQYVKRVEIPFDKIRELLVEAEYELAPEGKPLVWHLVVLSGTNQRSELTWHFRQEATMNAAEQLALLAGKSIRTESDPTNSARWASWGYNFLR